MVNLLIPGRMHGVAAHLCRTNFLVYLQYAMNHLSQLRRWLKKDGASPLEDGLTKTIKINTGS